MNTSTAACQTSTPNFALLSDHAEAQAIESIRSSERFVVRGTIPTGRACLLAAMNADNSRGMAYAVAALRAAGLAEYEIDHMVTNHATVATMLELVA